MSLQYSLSHSSFLLQNPKSDNCHHEIKQFKPILNKSNPVHIYKIYFSIILPISHFCTWFLPVKVLYAFASSGVLHVCPILIPSI